MQINLRCFSCHTPFSVNQEEVEGALTQLFTEGHKYYNALCPRCGKANKVGKARLRRAAPNWEPPKKTAK